MKPKANYRGILIFIFFVYLGYLNAQDYVGFSANETSSCDSLGLVLTNESSFTIYQGAVNYEWYLYGSYISNDPVSFDTTLYPGNYNFRLEARDTLENPLGDMEVNVEIIGAPDQFYISSGSQICPGEEVNFHIDFNQDSLINATWNLGNGIFKYGTWINTVYSTPGVYNVKLVIESTCGSDTLNQSVEVTNSAIPDVHAHTQSGEYFCPNDEIHFELDEEFPMATWNFGDGSTMNGIKVPHAYSLIGEYEVIVTATNTCNNSNNDTLHVWVQNDMPAWADFDYWFESYNGDNCPGYPVHFNPHSSGNYYWEFGDGGTSNQVYPVNIYADSGYYEVKLVVANGCGNSDTSTQFLSVDLKPFETLMEEVRFMFEDEWDETVDTFEVCPNEDVKFRNETHAQSQLEFEWDFGDATTSNDPGPVHSFSNAQVYTITLQAKDMCERTGSATKYILVDPTQKPEANLQVVPFEICPGEEVYFFDDDHDPEKNKNSYSIWFGDGSSVTNLTEPTHPHLHTLANHTYASDGTYNFIFTVTNKCNNTDTLEGTINVSDDPNRKPFYYVENSTYNEDNQPPEDWSVRQSPDDHEIQVPVYWSEWSSPMTDTFFVFLWYGSFNPTDEDDQGTPDGIVQFQSNTIIVGDTVNAYVPMNPMAPPSVGLAAGWFCDPKGIMDREPESWAMPDSMGIPIESIPIMQGGSTDLGLVTSGGFLYLSTWDGVCYSDKLEGDWLADSGNFVAKLNLWEEMDEYYKFSIHSSFDGADPYQNLISEGMYTQKNDSVTFYPDNGNCMDSAIYTFTKTKNELMFTKVYETCQERSHSLLLDTFFIDNYKEDDKTGCPGDSVKFTIAGGLSYEWHFDDGSGPSTNQFSYHAYADTGSYDAYVFATNACGRIDTMYTPVRIQNTHLPNPYFYIENYGAHIKDTIRFRYEINDNPELYNSYQFEWNFGDGTTSNAMNPVHVYMQPGDHEVELTVTNGCGSSSEHRNIYIEDIWDECELLAKFSFMVKGDTVYFTNNSIGSSISDLNWHFGDQNTSTVKNPVHIYSEQRKYTVCLSIYDSINDCADQICHEVIIGNPDIIANYSFTVNNTTNTVFFTDQSLNATNWFWNFDNFGTSVLKDPTFQFPSPGYYEVCLTAKNNSTNASDTKCKVLQIGSLDTTDCYVSFSYFIQDLKVNFTSEISGSINGGQWDFGDGTKAFVPNPEHIYAKPGEYEVAALVYNTETGCQAEAIKRITVGDIACQAEFDFLIDPDTKTVDFFSKSTGNITSWQWNFGDGVIVNAKDTSHTYAKGDIYPVCLIVKNSSTGCYSQICKEIEIAGADETICDAKFSFILEENTRRVKFTENSQDDFTHWTWKFGDNTIGTGQSITHEYQKDGVYNVCLMAKNDTTNCFSQKCKTVSVALSTENIPSLIADYAYTIDYTSQEVEFINKTKGNTTKHYWTFGDGSYDENVDTINHIYTYPRIYQACIYAVDEDAGLTSTHCKDILIKTAECDIDAGFTYFVDPDTKILTLKDKSFGNVNSWFWKFGDGITSSKQNPTHTYTNPGYYLVGLSVRDTLNKCNDFQTELIQVGTADCMADFDFNVDPATNTVEFINLSTGSVSNYFWMFDDYNTSTDENPVHVFNTAGLHFVSLTVSDNSGLCSDNLVQQIQVGNIDCSAKFSAYVDSAKNVAYFSSEIFGNVTKLNWKFGDGSISEQENPVHYYVAPGIYTVGLYAINESNGCMDYYEDLVLIGSLGEDCEARFVYQEGSTSKQIKFFDKSVGSGLTYNWDFGDGSSSTEKDPEHTFATGDYYNVCLTVVNDNDIQNTTCKFIQVEPDVIKNCFADFVYSIDSTLMTVNYVDKSYGDPDAWHWNFGNNESSQLQNPEYTYDSSGYYTVKLAISNSTTNCNSSHYEIVNVSKGDHGLIAGYGYEVDTSSAKSSGYPVDFIGVSTGKAAKFEWDFGDGSPVVSSTTTPTHIYSEAGTYTACFTVSDPITQQSNAFCQDVTVGITTLLIDRDVDQMAMDCYPNPFSNSTHIIYTLPKATTIDIAVFNTTGERIVTLLHQFVEEGSYSLTWDALHIRSGIYFVRLTASDGIVINKMVTKH